MPRQSKAPSRSGKPGAPAATAPWPLAVHPSPLRARLELLEKQHARLLRDVTKKRQSLQVLAELSRDVMSELASRVEPFQRELVSNVDHVRRLFEKLLSTKGRLTARQRRITREIYDDVLGGLPLDVRLATEPQTDEPPEPDAFDFEGDPWRGSAADGVGDFDGEAEVASARQPEGRQAASLRELFKRLVARLHPDKVTDEELKVERTVAMKEVTEAYQSGDLARLIELESGLAEVLSAGASDEVTARAERLERLNRELRDQLRQLTAERKELRDSLPFRIDLRAPKRIQDEVGEQLELWVKELEQEAEQFRALREFVQRFSDGKMGFDEFCLGPPRKAVDLDDEFEALMARVLADARVAYSHRTHSPKATRHSRSSRK